MNKSKFLIIAISLMISQIGSAKALMIGPASLAAKTQEVLQMVAEEASNIAQQTEQAKVFMAQGYSKKELFEKAKKYASKKGKKLLDKKMGKSVDGTKQKNIEAVEAEKELYVNSRKIYFKEKIGLIDMNIKDARKELSEKKAEANKTKQEMKIKKSEFERVKKDPSKENTAFSRYMDAVGRFEAAEQACNELEILIKDLEKQKETLNKEAAKVGTKDDPQYVIFEERLKELKKAEEDESFVNKMEQSNALEWDSPDAAEKFSPKEEDYKKFLERFFYNPKDLANASGDEARVKFQTNVDRVTRERRFLLVNTTAHLLQVSATLRREVPERTDVLQDMFISVPKVSSELEAISAYTATRIENAKAILLYAKLQCARLQYKAANELLQLDAAKIPNQNYSEFDLAKYILTIDDVKALAEDANKTNAANDKVTVEKDVKVNLYSKEKRR